MTLPDYTYYAAHSSSLIPSSEYSGRINDAYRLLSAFCTKEGDDTDLYRSALIAQAEYINLSGNLLGHYGIREEKAGEVSCQFADNVSVISPLAYAILVRGGYYTKICADTEGHL